MTVIDRPDLRDAVERSADPLWARAALERLLDAHPGLDDELATMRSCWTRWLPCRWLRDRFSPPSNAIAVWLRCCAPTRWRHRARFDDARSLVEHDDPPTALRQWKRRHIARIAARDLLGVADLREAARELAGLAAACLDVALTLAEPRVPMSVIGMGKLGGAELNYASDVDVLFVHEGDGEAERAARAVLRVMTTPSLEGIVFRTDAALRPEGRAGPLSRTLDSYEAYWEGWAATWERQALIKARPVAGDEELGAAFMSRAERFIWPEKLDPDAVREVRLMKARTEEMLRRQGVSDREVKRGYGGIRDIEFAVQLLQMVHGRADHNVRERATLDALDELAAGGYVSRSDAAQLEEAYVWLRTVEHRLQLVDEQQTHTIPNDVTARTHLARVLGFRDSPDESAVEGFDDTHRRHQTVVRSIHERVFFAPLLDTLAGVGALPEAAAEERLRAFGFRDVEQTRAALHELTAGLTRRSRVMQQLLPAILGWLSAAPDPDLGLLQLRRLVEGYTRSSTLARRFRETPVAAERRAGSLGRRVCSGSRCTVTPTSSTRSPTTRSSPRSPPVRNSSTPRSRASTGGATTTAGGPGCAASSAASCSGSAHATSSVAPRSRRSVASSRISPTRASKARCSRWSRRCRSPCSASGGSAGASCRTHPTSTSSSCTTVNRPATSTRRSGSRTRLVARDR